MFEVENHNQGYRISTGDGRPAFAYNLKEVHLALDHYYDGAHWRGPHIDPVRNCPFCCQIAAANERPVITHQDCGCRIRAKFHTCGLVREEAKS